jgi:hypothetical protein
MKKIILSAAIILNFLAVNAQDIMETISKEACSCVKEKMDTNKDTKDLETQLGLCIIAGYSTHPKEVKRLYGNIVENEKP